MASVRSIEASLLAGTVSAAQARTPRRQFLKRAATAASVYALSPLRFAMQPAWADHDRCANTPCSCPAGTRCASGYSAFCCTITGENTCPANTFVGGWWRCNYTGSGYCADTSKRYYIDCHVRPGSTCNHCKATDCLGATRCTCASDKCSRRKTCCTKFRYGQCNNGRAGSRDMDSPPHTKPIKCRMVRCRNPGVLWPDVCQTGPDLVDQDTCAHEGCF